MIRLRLILALCVSALASVAAVKEALPFVEVPIAIPDLQSLDISASVSVGTNATTTTSESTESSATTSVLLAAAAAGSDQEAEGVSPSELPIFFFHGFPRDASDGASYAARFAALGRTFTALSFCEGEQSKTPFFAQAALAAAQIRSIVAADPETYAKGYIFMGHSQGGAVARTVIQEMDDHQVVMFISLAGAVNGLFNGPQPADAIPMSIFVNVLAPAAFPLDVLDTSQYTAEQHRGKLQSDFSSTLAARPELGDQIAFANMWRMPAREAWLGSNSWLPVLNNINVCSDAQCEQAKLGRKNNFLKLKALHSLTSPRDGAVAPWQSSHFAQYSDVSDISKIHTEFETLTVVPMEQTVEYTQDTYGLKTLHTSGRLHLVEAPDVVHACWVVDGPFLDDPNEFCSFDVMFDTYIYPIVSSTTKLGAGTGPCAGCQ